MVTKEKQLWMELQQLAFESRDMNIHPIPIPKKKYPLLHAYAKMLHNTATRCEHSKCDQWRGVKEFWSNEEGTVFLCKKHRTMNEGKTGHTPLSESDKYLFSAGLKMKKVRKK